MNEQRILVGVFDLLNVGHLSQINSVAGAGVDIHVVVVSDDGVKATLGTSTYLPTHERAAIVSQMRNVDEVSITGPESNWKLPVGDALFVDATLFHEGSHLGGVFAKATAVTATRRPAHPALVATQAVA